jgi:hypothetical protein
MNWLPKEIRIILAVIVLGAIGLAAAVQYTDICRLQAVTLNGRTISAPQQELGLYPERTIFQQPLDSLADALVSRNGIRQADIAYSLPNSLRITTNDLAPVCMLLDQPTGLLYALDATGRVLPLDKSSQDWERPVLTGVSTRRMYDFTSDSRVGQVVPQLEQLQKDHGDVYRLIREVDFSRPDYLTVSVSGLPCAIKVTSDRFQIRMDEFIHFMQQYDPQPYTASAFDLRYDDMIIRVAQDTTKKKDAAKFADTSHAVQRPVATVRPDAPVKPTVTARTASEAVAAHINKPVPPSKPLVLLGNGSSSKTVEPKKVIEAASEAVKTTGKPSPAAKAPSASKQEIDPTDKTTKKSASLRAAAVKSPSGIKPAAAAKTSHTGTPKAALAGSSKTTAAKPSTVAKKALPKKWDKKDKSTKAQSKPDMEGAHGR